MRICRFCDLRATTAKWALDLLGPSATIETSRALVGALMSDISMRVDHVGQDLLTVWAVKTAIPSPQRERG